MDGQVAPSASTTTPPDTSVSPPVPSPTDTSAANNTHLPRVRRRNRTIASCLECRRRKLKCDKASPCSNCTRFKRDCLYLAPALDSNSRNKLNEIKDRIGSIEQTITRDLLKSPTTPTEITVGIKVEDSDQDDVDEPDDERDLEPGMFTQLDQVYEDNADDEIMDLGIQLGKVRVSERIGGFVVPNLANDLGKVPAMLNQAEQGSTKSLPDANLRLGDAYPSLRQLAQQQHPIQQPHYLSAGPDYRAPASDFLFAQNTQSSPLAAYLPLQVTCDQLIRRYWEAVHPVVTIVHRPSFDVLYSTFWTDIAAGTDPRHSSQAVIFAALFMSSITYPEDQALATFGVSKPSIVDRLKSGTEMALSRANLLRTAKLETMQAFVMYLIPLCRAEVSRAHSALTGMAIRLAECMGLHRDGTHYGFSAVEIHVRRLIWYNLCCLDIRTCEATGPRPQIKREDYDTRLPLNVEEKDLMLNPPPTTDSPHFTSITVTRLKFECIEAHRALWHDIVRIDAKQTKLGHVINKVQKFRQRTEEQYGTMLRGRDARQMLALHVYRILSNRLLITLLHRYIFPDRKQVPDRLRTICIDACLSTNEHSVALDTRLELAPWAWYRGAMQQFSSSLLLMQEVSRDPFSPNAARIWKCLDYIFELPNDITADEKIVTVFKTLQDRITVFQSFRKVRAGWEGRGLQASQDSMKSALHTPPSDDSTNSLPTPSTGLMQPQQFSMPPLIHQDSNPQITERSTTASPADINLQMMEDIDWSHFDMPAFGMDNNVEFEFGTIPHDHTAPVNINYLNPNNFAFNGQAFMHSPAGGPRTDGTG